MPIRRRALAALAALPFATRAEAQAPDWPRRPIRLIAAFAPGGATDINARVLAERLSHDLGQQMVVENRAGAAGIIGTEAGARAAPDGYTLLMGTISTHAMNVPLYGARLSYDPIRDFAPVSRFSTSSNLLVVHPGVEARDIAGLIAYAKANPGKLAYGSGGNGTSTHLAGEMFKAMAGVDILHVPFRSTAPATTALTAGQIQLMFDTAVSALPLVREGRLRALGVTSPERLPTLPDLPAVAETLPGFEMGTWLGVFAPPATPRAIIDKVDAATRAALADPAFQARLAQIGVEPFPAGPEEFATFVAREIERWTMVVRRASITAD